MPSRNKRREFDVRAGRFESEVRVSEFERIQQAQAPLYMCEECRRPFEEKSRHCPRCDKKRMGEIRTLKPEEAQEARRKSIARLQAKYG